MIEFDYTRLIVETAITCLLYGIIMIFVLLVFKKGWLQEYPRAVREKYLEMHQDVKIKKNWVYILKLFLKKIIAMSIYIVTMLFVAQTAKYSDIFISENMILVPVIWLVITVFEILVLDIGIIGHVKKIRLPGTEECSAEYRKVGKKALLDGGLGLLFGIVVYYVMFAVFMIIMTLSIKAEKALIAQYEKELEAMKASSYETAPDTYKDLVDSLFAAQVDDATDETDTFNEFVLNNIKDALDEYPIEDTLEEYPKYQTEDVNSGREIVRERPVLKGESLWSIAEEIYGDPYKWINIYEQNKDVIGEDPGTIYRGQFLEIPEDNNYFYSDYEKCYEDAIAETFHWEGIEPYIAPDCGYEIQNCIFYYTVPEGEGEQFKICYPKLIAHNGKDVSAVNAGIRERAMKMADELLVNRSQDLSDSLLYDERYSTKWTRSSVNYVITYLDEDVISVVFQDYMFIGSILGEDISMRTYVADINTGICYKNEDLLKNMDDLYVANLIYEDMLLQHADSEYETMIFEEVLTPHLMAEALQTNGTIDGRYFMNTFLTKDGVGFSFSYRVGQEIDGSYSIMRGWTKTILSKEQVANYMSDAPVWGEWLKLRELYEEPTYFFKDIDWEKFQARLSKEEAKTLQKYLPVLMGGEFTWIERSFTSNNGPHEPKQVVIQDIIDRVEPQEIMVDSISIADVFQSGTQDVILYFPIIGGHYLILHEEDGVIYGIDYPVRWFQDLQEDGLYCSSGSAFFQRYYKMTFSDGDFAEHLIATIDEGVFYIGDEKQGSTDEESWELYLIWREENTQNPVKRYNPFEVN